MSSISTLSGQQVDKQGTEGEACENLNKEDKALLTLNGDVQYDENLSMKVTVQHQTPGEYMRHGTHTCREQLTGRAHIADSMAQKTLIVNMLTTHKNYEGDKGHKAPIGDLKTFNRDENEHITSYEKREGSKKR